MVNVQYVINFQVQVVNVQANPAPKTLIVFHLHALMLHAALAMNKWKDLIVTGIFAIMTLIVYVIHVLLTVV